MYFFCNNIWSQNFLLYDKGYFQEKRGFYLFYNNVIFKDCILFKYIQWNIETEVIAVKKYMSF